MSRLQEIFEEIEDKIDSLETENAELRQKAENNQTCYVCEAAWVERVGQILLNRDMLHHNGIDEETEICIPDEIYEDLLLEYKALGHSVTVEEPCQ